MTTRSCKKNLGGIRKMKSLPQALFVIDTHEEETAVREARKLNIPVVGIVDTNCDPEAVRYPVPGNDDAIRAITLFSRVVARSVEEGRASRAEGRETAVDIAAAPIGAPLAAATLAEAGRDVETPARPAPRGPARAGGDVRRGRQAGLNGRPGDRRGPLSQDRISRTAGTAAPGGADRAREGSWRSVRVRSKSSATSPTPA